MIRIDYDGEKKHFHLSNGRFSYLIDLAGGRYPLHLYWGKAVRQIREDLLKRRTGLSGDRFTLHGQPLDRLPQECPVFGCGDLREGMLQVRHPDGTEALDLQYLSHRITEEKPALPGLPSARGEGSRTLVLTLRDEESGLEADLHYTLWEDCDVLARSVLIRNTGSETQVLEKCLSFCLDLEGHGLRLLTLQGSWAREREWTERPLVMGDQGTGTVRSASSQQTSPFLALKAPGCTETEGTCMGFALCWSGSFLANVHVDQHGDARVMMGIHPFDFSWTLAPGECFAAPEGYLCFSGEGLGGMSRTFHRLVHRHITRSAYAASPRPILINNWEATYFDFDRDKLLSIAACARDCGIDLFVLDDGWFGRRDSDNCSLGDWQDDLRKLPDGLRGLSDGIHALGMKFGLWVEPEMVSPDSDLYRAHPDWCIHAGNRIRVESRHQLVLDMTRADVREHVFTVIRDALERGSVDYVKWDMNRNIDMIGSEKLPPERMKEFSTRYILGVYEVMGRITAAFPKVLFESCAGGGGRFDLGMMCMMPQAWTSDDTDAWMRCRIPYSTSLLFPASCMGAHVSAVPNHQTGRVSPLRTRAAAAMGGTYGYEMDPRTWTAQEKEEVRALNDRVREWQDVLLYGDHYRLRSPYDGDECAWMSVSPDKKRAVVTHVYKNGLPNHIPGLLRLCGLAEDMEYTDTDTGLTFGGDELLFRGIPLDAPRGDYSARQYFLRAADRSR